ncbi:MAG: geranylgeranyl reductase family protein [Candidatus Lokiarchaeota archaeon]|nr:geranylgeranyl reductase family protein [Candidatus Lokiarchaeota archaeon]
MKADVTVIGAGPAGILASIDAASRGHKVLIFEEHPAIGKPDHCAGLLSTSGIQELGLKLPKDVIQNHVSGARIFSPSGKSILIERGKREAFVVDRIAFDRWLADKAHHTGVQIKTSSQVTKIVNNETEWIAHIKQKESKEKISSRRVVNAEGVRCYISRSIGFYSVPRKSKMPAYQFELKNVDAHEDLVEMYYDNRVAPGFFCWLIPLGERRARVGLAARDYSKIRLKSAISHHPILKKRLRNATVERGFGGIVLVGKPIKKTIGSNFVVVGDAAGIVKATTGGGVILGGKVARLAGKHIAQSLEADSGGQTHLEKFEKIWRKSLMNDLRLMYLVQKLIGSLSNKGLDSLIGDAADLGLVSTVKKEGDMDRQGRVIAKLLGNPKTFLAGLKAIRYLRIPL